jgi:hypothetical protein
LVFSTASLAIRGITLSTINAYKKPQDLVFKLLREGRRTWITSDCQEKCDHFFNYCVTAHALKDWCIKHLNLSKVEKERFHTEMNAIQYFSECRDIANSSKHFGLDNKESSVMTAFPVQSEFAVITGELDSGQYEKVKRMDISILLIDGIRIDLFGFLHHTANNWIETLKRRGIPCKDGYSPAYMFIEYS